MKKFAVILSYFLFISFFITLCIAIFSKYNFFYFISLTILIIFIMLIITLIFKSKNKFSSKANKIYKENHKSMKTILKKELELSQSKTILEIEFIDNDYYLLSKSNNHIITYKYSNSEQDNDLLYFLFYKLTSSIIFSHSLKSIMSLIFTGKLLIKKEFKNLEVIDFQIKKDNIIWSKYIKLRFGDVTLSPNWRIN